MKKIAVILLSALMTLSVLAGCNKEQTSDTITVISRELGSGTRGAFIELFGIEKTDESGKKIDHTVSSAEISSSTSAIITSVENNKTSIGYISLGSLSDKVKAVKIDGVSATVDNVKNGTYKISRPFNVVTKSDVSEAAQDFINYILSAEGQEVIEDNNYISEGNKGAFNGGKVSGKITISGSSSVTPVMEKLKEAYNKINANLTIDIQQHDSSKGISDVIEGNCDIGMASRELKSSETEKGAQAMVIALDGIAVIVNKNNAVSELTSAQVYSIFTGEKTKWSEI